MNCKKCSAVIPDGGLFCPSCGARADGNKECKSCGKLIPDDSVFCIFCGNRVDGNKLCPKCSKPIPENAVYCTHCQARVDQKQQCLNCGEYFEGDFCPSCGVAAGQKKAAENTATEPTPAIPVIIPVVASETAASAVPTTQTVIASAPQLSTAEENDSALDAIICTQCGSADVDVIAKDMARCKNCGAQILINKPKDVKNVSNTVHIHMDSNLGDSPISFYALPELTNSQDFLSEALAELALDKETPEDIIDNSEFSPVDTQYRQYLIASGTANLSYSATVGYDYQVTYTEYVNGKPQKRTRTETKWEPFSGTHTGDYTRAVANGDDAETSDPSGYLTCYELNNEAVEISKVDFATETPSAPDKETISNANQAIKTAAEVQCENSLPGHRHRQFSCSGSVKLNSMECHVAPQHILDYKYRDESKKLYAHSFSSCLVRGSMVNTKKETANEIEQSIKLYNIIALALMIASIIVSLTVPLTFIVVIFGVAAIGWFIFLEVMRAKTRKAIYKKKRLTKLKAVIKYLKGKGMNVPQRVYDMLDKLSEKTPDQPTEQATAETIEEAK